MEEKQTASDVKIDWIQRDVQEIKNRLERNYITREEFDPIKKIVYGVVGLIMVTVITGLLTLVLR